MARPRDFNEADVLVGATQLFSASGYAAVSVEMIVTELGISRSSFYKIFGSKQRLFLKTIEDVVVRAQAGDIDDSALDCVLVGLMELSGADEATRDALRKAVTLCFEDDPQQLGMRILKHARLTDGQ